jgi:pimeloyl-ACP methyl ester carboxylesterase
MREFWFENGGTRLFAVEDGAGPTIIMLHGGLADHRASLPLVAPLAGRFRVVVPDLRASGRSWDSRPLSWDVLADDLTVLMEHLGVSKAVVGGTSGGTGVAVRFALRHPDQVAGLVLVQPAYGGTDHGLTTHQTAAFGYAASLGSRAIEDGVQVLRPLFAQVPPGVRELALAMLDDFDASSVVATTHFLGAGMQPFQSATELRSLDMPVLLVPGDDLLHPAEISALYAENIPHRKVRATKDPPAVIAEFCDQDARW